MSFRVLSLSTLLATALVTGCATKPQADAADSRAQPQPSATAATQPAAAQAVANGFASIPPPGTKTVCPVTGDEFEVTGKTSSSVYQGKTYVFCCPDCNPKFDADPAKYTKP